MILFLSNLFLRRRRARRWLEPVTCCVGEAFSFLELETRTGAPVRIGRTCSSWVRMILYSEGDRVKDVQQEYPGGDCVSEKETSQKHHCVSGSAGTNAQGKAPGD